MRNFCFLAVVLTGLLGCASVHFGSEVRCELTGEVTSPLPSVGGSTLHVISWNLHGTPTAAPTGERLAKVARVLLERRPDLVLLQEVWFKGDADQLTAHLGKVYTRVEDSSLTQHFFGWLIGLRKSGLLAFSRTDSGWVVASREPGFVPFSVAAPKWRVWEMDGFSAKGFQYFDVQKLDLRLLVINTHLQSPYRADENPFRAAHPYEKERRAQINQLADFVDEQSETTETVVFGDFNTFPEDDSVYPTLDERFTDLSRSESRKCRCGTIVDETGRRQEWIDYVLTRHANAMIRVENLRLIRSFKTDCPFSDHHGLETRLRLRQ